MVRMRDAEAQKQTHHATTAWLEDPDGIRIEMNYISKEGWDAVAARANASLASELGC